MVRVCYACDSKNSRTNSKGSPMWYSNGNDTYLCYDCDYRLIRRYIGMRVCKNCFNKLSRKEKTHCFNCISLANQKMLEVRNTIRASRML